MIKRGTQMKPTTYQSTILKPPLAPTAVNTRIDIRSIATLYDAVSNTLPIRSVSELVRVAFEDTLNYRVGKLLYTVEEAITYLIGTGIWTKSMANPSYLKHIEEEKEILKQKKITYLEQQLKGDQ